MQLRGKIYKITRFKKYIGTVFFKWYNIKLNKLQHLYL